jgi:hypothetical protein
MLFGEQKCGFVKAVPSRREGENNCAQQFLADLKN